MKKTILWTITLAFVLGQANAQEVISNQGDSYSTTAGKIDYTLGEFVIETLGDVNNALTQGFHQSGISVTNIKDYNEGLKISVFPNPVRSELTIEIENIGNDYSAEIIDLNGKLIMQRIVNTSSTTLDVYQINTRVYLLNLRNEKHEKLKTYRIQKIK